jgi:hypothetical protein
LTHNTLSLKISSDYQKSALSLVRIFIVEVAIGSNVQEDAIVSLCREGEGISFILLKNSFFRALKNNLSLI